MASVFSYDPDPPKLVSPWEDLPHPAGSLPAPNVGASSSSSSAGMQHRRGCFRLGGLEAPSPAPLADGHHLALKPEPQDGPVEYKLHLLLRPRRSFSRMTTAAAVSGSHRSRAHDWAPETAPDPMFKVQQSSLMAVPTLQVRQNRLQHLTTQLLWRLQQSSPYHATSVADLVLPRLPEATLALGAPSRPEKLLPGLEQSRGALYEIGVSDDGSFVGLSEEEMAESLTNLRAMAASLGCSVRIVRCVAVGDCEWTEPGSWPAVAPEAIHASRLLVAEALVFPDLVSRSDEPHETAVGPASAPLRLAVTNSAPDAPPAAAEAEASGTEQLRVSLTGRSAAGKSSLLGTLSTSTFDNGRGKSRLSLLKHRHEIASGMTSSVASELIGYNPRHEGGAGTAAVVNYGCGNVSSWDDIHNAADGGRLVFLTDSAGHPRYRRTTVRGLISWAPHWTLCCIAATDDGSSSGGSPRSSGDDGSGQDDAAGSSFAHLELCLELRLPLVVLVTKHDRATRDGLRQVLSKILSKVKAKGRKPALLVKPCPAPREQDLQSFSAADQDEILSAVRDEPGTVPILLTSAVTGSGIRKVHALLCNLPIPKPTDGWDGEADSLFHVDEVYSLPSRAGIAGQPESGGIIVASGYLKDGLLSVGDTVQVGPFTVEQNDLPRAVAMERTRSNPSRMSSSPIPRLSQSMPREENVRHFTPPPSTPTPVVLRGEFLAARVVSMRNLRLPVKQLLADQAGTVGLHFAAADTPSSAKLRKGMVIRGQPARDGSHAPSYAAVKVRFRDEDYLSMEPGALFNLYVASARAASKIVTVEAVPAENVPGPDLDAAELFGSHALGSTAGIRHLAASPGSDGQFDMDEKLEELDLAAKENARQSGMIDVIFRFLYSPEWVEPGATVLAMPGHAVEGGVGLEGFVGRVTEVIE